MDSDRAKKIERGEAKITKAEWDAGWHCCWAWDGMVVNSNDTEGEGSCCTCKDTPYPEGDE